jgi:hypothetical protein
MTNTLEVLVIESHRGAAAAAVHDLEAAGHHVRRCYDEDRHGFPCRGVVDVAQCPLARHAEGRVDRGSGQPSPISGRSMCSCSSITRIVSGVTAAISAASTSRIDSTPTARPARATTKWRTP